MAGNPMYLLILTLNVKGLDAPIKRHRIANWFKKNKIQPHVAYKRHISLKKINTGLESKDGKRFSKQINPQNMQE
jgi:hypothetical protein